KTAWMASSPRSFRARLSPESSLSFPGQKEKERASAVPAPRSLRRSRNPARRLSVRPLRRTASAPRPVSSSAAPPPRPPHLLLVRRSFTRPPGLPCKPPLLHSAAFFLSLVTLE